ncbi:MAG: hypothetical protein R3E84_14530 [Pseudomonadales bacterium]
MDAAGGVASSSIGAVDASGVVLGNPGFSSNSAFNGSPGNQTLLDVAQPGSLRPGDFVTVPITVTFYPATGSAPFEFQFTASGDLSANGVADSEVTDLSTSGTDIDDNGDVSGG